MLFLLEENAALDQETGNACTGKMWSDARFEQKRKAQRINEDPARDLGEELITFLLKDFEICVLTRSALFQCMCEE